MDTTFTQEKRLIALEKSPFGKDVLLLTAFSGQEAISRLFNYQLEMLSIQEDIAARDIVGKKVTFRIKYGDDQSRYFNGFVSRFSASGLTVRDMRLYRAEVVPWLWFLTRTADCRIFQNKTIPQIIEQIFKDLGFSDYEITEIKGDHPKWDYCVQYRETDFNFVSRLMEQEGIFYWFRHEQDKHTLVLADHKGAYKDLPEKEADYVSGAPATLLQSHILSWEHRYEFLPGKWTQTDYNFETPSTSLQTSTPTVVDLPDMKKYECYDYPGLYCKRDAGEKLTRLRMEETESAYDIVNATGSYRSFTPGGKFTVKRHECSSEEHKTYLITSITHSAAEPTYLAGEDEGEKYSNTFMCIPADVIFRPARTTPRPIVQGPQTAVVVGPGGEEIYTDKYGRVKIQFHWDREGKKNESSSCWVRVSHPWAGKGWGSVSIPRIGQEVIVDFLEGDPDRPIITGRVYNAEQMPPFGLPAGAVTSGIKSNSTKGGGGYNEIAMDDTKGNEMLRTHAQFNMDTTVENDQTLTVHNNRTSTIDVNDTESVGNNQTISIGVDQSETIGSNQTVSIGSNQSVTIGSNQTVGIGANQGITVGANKTVTVSANHTENVGSNQSVTIGSNKTESIGIAYALTVGAAMNQAVGAVLAQEVGGAKTVAVGGISSENVGISKSVNAAASISEKAGSNFSAQAGGTMSLKANGDFSAKTSAKGLIAAASELVLECGSAKIIMKSGGEIMIKGTDITIKGSGKINAKADGDITLKGSKINEN
jgi:type VI secretion system secreted protein VgrG